MSESNVASDHAVESPSDSPDERGDCDCEWIERLDGEARRSGIETGSDGMGSLGCDVAEAGMCL